MQLYSKKGNGCELLVSQADAMEVCQSIGCATSRTNPKLLSLGSIRCKTNLREIFNEFFEYQKLLHSCHKRNEIEVKSNTWSYHVTIIICVSIAYTSNNLQANNDCMTQQFITAQSNVPPPPPTLFKEYPHNY